MGLRTLLLGKKTLEEEKYLAWKESLKKAQAQIEEKEEAIALVQEEIETELTLVGATAIEDKLQDDVGNTIAYIKRAGIKVWVLTGDKLETAINIGYSCELLDDGLLQLIIEEKTKEEIVAKMQSLQQQIE